MTIPGSNINIVNPVLYCMVDNLNWLQVISFPENTSKWWCTYYYFKKSNIQSDLYLRMSNKSTPPLQWTMVNQMVMCNTCMDMRQINQVNSPREKLPEPTKSFSFLISLLLDSIKQVCFPSMLNKRKDKLKPLCWPCFSSTERIRGQILMQVGAIAW